MVRNTRTISWLKAALKDFLDFSQDAQDKASTALTFVAEGAKPDIAKPLAGLGSVACGSWRSSRVATLTGSCTRSRSGKKYG